MVYATLHLRIGLDKLIAPATRRARGVEGMITRVLRGAMALPTLLLLLVACAPPPQADDAIGGERPAAEDEPAAENGTTAEEGTPGGGTLVVGRTGDVDNLDPHLATAFQTVQALELVYDSLFELDPEANVVPGLAEDWEFEDDGRTLRVTLREDVAFHNGDALDSGDVKATIERTLDEATGAVARSNLLAIESVETPDERTAVLRLTEPDAALPAALADVNAAILSQESIESATVGNEPNGTGAFAFSEWTQGQSFTVTANAEYWGGAPALDGVEVRVIPDESSVLAGLRAGEFHLGVLTDPTVVTQIGEDLEVERTPALAYHALMLNPGRGPLEDPRVRQAISCVIDREELIESAVFGEGEVTGPFTIPAYESEPYEGLGCMPPDVERAQELLAEAGQEGGLRLNTIVMTGGYATAVNEAQSLQSQLDAIGVTLELEQLETNVYVDRWLAGDFDAAVALNSGKPDPHHMYVRYFTSDGNLNQVAAYSSPELDELFAAGKAATDVEERRDVYAEIAEHLVSASPWAWLFNGYEYRVLQPQVEGFVPMPTGSLKSLRDTSLGG